MRPNGFEPIKFRGNYFGGRFVPAKDDLALSQDPGDLDRPVGEFRSSVAAVDEAVESARRATSSWRSQGFQARRAAVLRYQKILRDRQEAIAWTIARETGKPWNEAKTEVQGMIDKVDVTLSEALSLIEEKIFPLDAVRSTSPFPSFRRRGRPRPVGPSSVPGALRRGFRGGSVSNPSHGRIHRHPRGVVAVIGPFNVPGHIPNGQIVPALLTGNTVVFKPSELSPFVGQIIAECFASAGFPPGVFNLIQGGGSVGARLAASNVDVVFFTGSTKTGDAIRRLCADQPSKLVALEMGGKNAALVLEDAPLAWTVKEIVHGAFSTTGQRCSSTSRVFIPRRLSGSFLRLLLEEVDAMAIGYFTEDPAMGPLVREDAVRSFLNAQETAESMGFKAVRQGGIVRKARRGYYVTPSVHLYEGDPITLLLRDPKGSIYWDQELFAPDVAVYVVSKEQEMILCNNASRYGLVASVFTASRSKFRRISEELENGVIHWNRTTAMTPGRLPFGGIKASGNHWPAGLFVPLACTYPVGSVEMEVKG